MGNVKKVILILVIIIAILGIWQYTNEPSNIDEDNNINETIEEDAEIEVISNGTWALTVTIKNETKEYSGDGNETIVLGKIGDSKDVKFNITSKKEGTSAEGTLYKKGVLIKSDSDTYVSTSSNTEDEYTTEYSGSTSNSGRTSNQESSSSGRSSNSVRCWCGQIH